MTNTTDPTWRTRAAQLIRAARHDDAHQLAYSSVRSQEFALELAELYLEAAIELRREGNAAKADDARRRAYNWASFYPVQATSGGEGTAMSLERDRFHQRLESLFNQPPQL